jgi:hypothetical protein
MINGCITEQIKLGDWRITTGQGQPGGMISVQSFASEEEARTALKEGNYSFD